MLFSKNALLNILLCNSCHGGGFKGIVKCSECKGMGMGKLARGKFLYWGEPLTHYHISLRKARRWLNRFLILGALIFAFGFLGIFAWVIYSRDLFKLIWETDFWLTGGASNPTILFWLSIISFSFLVYRLLASGKVLKPVEWRSYKEIKEQPNVESEEGLQTWK